MSDQFGMVKQGGNVYRAVKIDPSHVEAMRQLQSHPGWIIYKNLLSAQRDNALFGLMSSEVNDEKYSKRIGRAEGLHLAASTLDTLILDFDQRAKRVAGESTNQPDRDGQIGKEFL